MIKIMLISLLDMSIFKYEKTITNHRRYIIVN